MHYCLCDQIPTFPILRQSYESDGCRIQQTGEYWQDNAEYHLDIQDIWVLLALVAPLDAVPSRKT